MPDGLLADHDAPGGRGPEVGGCRSRADTILGLARQAFIDKGFDGASMQDLARAAGMSAGNFYRYFSCKAGLIEALIDRDIAEIEAEFGEIVVSADPLSILKDKLRLHMLTDDPCDDALWAEISASAARKPEVARALQRMETSITHRIAQVLARVRGVPDDEAVERFGTHAQAVFLIMHGVMTGNRHKTAYDPGLITIVMRTVEWVLDDAVADRSEGTR